MFVIARHSRTRDDVLRLVMNQAALKGQETAAVLVFDNADAAQADASKRGPDFFVLPLGLQAVVPEKKGFFASLFG